MARTFRCGRKEFRLGERTFILGILNVTPDSFSDGGRFFDPDLAVAHAKEMVAQGADIIDVGGESSRPGSDPVSAREEKRRVLPVIEALADRVDVPISIDTYKSEVARDALEKGASMVNDISGLKASPDMVDIVAERDASLVVMHMRGMPKTMQKAPRYKDVVNEVVAFLKRQADRARRAGMGKDQILVDPGIGFGKTVDHNLELIRELGAVRKLGYPVLIGTSRKSFIGHILGTQVNDRLEGTIATNVVAVLHGADFVRVHDVREIKRALTLTDSILHGTER